MNNENNITYVIDTIVFGFVGMQFALFAIYFTGMCMTGTEYDSLIRIQGSIIQICLGGFSFITLATQLICVFKKNKENKKEYI